MTFDLFRAGRPGQWFLDHDPSLSIKPAAFAQDILNDGATVTVDENGLTVIEGAITVTNAGETVIIDGTSNMFKIQASGTTSVTQAANTVGTSAVTLTALGPLAASPGHLGFISDTEAATDPRALGSAESNTTGFVAATSGGAVTLRTVVTLWRAWSYTLLNGSSVPVITLALFNASTSSVTTFLRYYILKEAAL